MGMNRRRFIVNAGTALAATIAIPAIPDVLYASKSKIDIGIQLYNFRDHLPQNLETILSNISKAGYQYVETYDYSKENGFWGLSPKELSELLKKYKLYTPSGHYNANALIENGSLDEIDHAIEAAKILKQSYVTFPWVEEKDRKTAKQVENIVSKINLAAERIHASGMKMGYHNHDFELRPIEGVTLFEELLSKSDPKKLDFEMDLYWTVRVGQNPMEWIKKYPNRIKLIHIKDINMSKPNDGMEIGTGNINIGEIMKDAKSAGVKFFIVEQENFRIDPFESIKRSYSYVNKTLNQ